MNLVFVYREMISETKGKSYAGCLAVLLLVHVLMKLLSVPLRHTQRINIWKKLCQPVSCTLTGALAHEVVKCAVMSSTKD